MDTRKKYGSELELSGIELLELAHRVYERGGQGDNWLYLAGWFFIYLGRLVTARPKAVSLKPDELESAARAFLRATRAWRAFSRRRHELVRSDAEWSLIEAIKEEVFSLWTCSSEHQEIMESALVIRERERTETPAS